MSLITSLIQRLILSLWLGMLPSFTVGQHVVPVSNSFKGTWIAGIQTGVAIPFMDLTESGLIPKNDHKHSNLNMAGGLYLGVEINPSLMISGQIFIARLNDQNFDRNQYFLSSVTELNGVAAYNILKLFLPNSSDQRFKVHLLGGAGLCFYHSGVYNLLTDETLIERGANATFGFTGKVMEGVIISGISIRFNITKNIDIFATSAQRWMNADNFESVKGGFAFDNYNISSIGIQVKLKNEKPYPMIFEDFRRKIE